LNVINTNLNVLERYKGLIFDKSITVKKENIYCKYCGKQIYEEGQIICEFCGKDQTEKED
jgi:predicted amidophosphoribosyltransferase